MKKIISALKQVITAPITIVKDIIKIIMILWEYLLYAFIAFCVLFVLFGWRIWLADGDIKCTLAHDPATCAAVKSNN